MCEDLGGLEMQLSWIKLVMLIVWQEMIRRPVQLDHHLKHSLTIFFRCVCERGIPLLLLSYKPLKIFSLVFATYPRAQKKKSYHDIRK